MWEHLEASDAIVPQLNEGCTIADGLIESPEKSREIFLEIL